MNRDAGVVLVADLGATHARIALSDLDGTPLVERAADLDIAVGPDEALGWVAGVFNELLAELGRSPDEVYGIGIGVPGPVEFCERPAGQPADHARLGRVRHPRVVADALRRARAGRQRREHHGARRAPDALAPRPSTSSSSRSAPASAAGSSPTATSTAARAGAAGDIGHVRATDRTDVVCRCGNVGCLEAIAGGEALARRLADEGEDATRSRDVVSLVQAGHAGAIRMVRDAGRTLGEVLAGTVNFFNPAVIVIGGDIAEAHAELLAGVREGIFSRSLPLATRDLRIVPCRLGDRAGVTGAATMAIEHVLAPDAVDRALGDAA